MMKVGQTLGSFKLLEIIGKGGQGTVFKALDTRLDRLVAVKVLSPDLKLRKSGFARFKREAKLASSLDHPNICAIYGFYEDDGATYIVMPFIEGETVRQLSADRGPLQLRSALSIILQVTDALNAAHAKGIVHRDIKAGNIIVTPGGLVKVLDFGLAKLLDPNAQTSPAEQADDRHLTIAGIPYGTPSSSAPEMALGEPSDHRADIFSTGVVLYQLLTGEFPFDGKTVAEVRDKVITEPPRSLKEARGADLPVPPRLQEIVDRALAKNPEDRYQTAAEMQDDLRRILQEIETDGAGVSSLPVSGQTAAPAFAPKKSKTRISKRPMIAGAIILLVLTAALSFYFFYTAQKHEIESLAVLPFVNLSETAEADYLAEGITESLIDSLSEIPNLRVRSRDAVYRYQDSDQSSRDIGRALKAHAVLSGRIREIGDEILISVELIDATDDTHLWGKQYRGRMADIVALTSEITRDIAANLDRPLSEAEDDQLVKNYKTNSAAYRNYLQGRFFWNKRTPQNLFKSIEYFERAVSADRDYAPAYSGLADCYSLLSVYNVRPEIDFNSKARDAAVRALQLDSNLAEAHASLGLVNFRYEWKWREGKANFERSIELDDEYPAAHQWFAALLSAEGDHDGALREIQKALEIDPFSLSINLDRGKTFYYAGRFDESAAAYRRALELEPNSGEAHLGLGLVLAQKNEYEAAIQAINRAIALREYRIKANLNANERNQPDEAGVMETPPAINADVRAISYLGYIYARQGRRPEAQEQIAQLKKLAQTRDVSPYYSAMIAAGLGEKNAALDDLEKAREKRFSALVFLKVEPVFSNLQHEARFKKIVEEMK